ncbi:MAG: helix-turn-helix transcriptional regulator [Flavobacteriaceae bacterium]|nr:helix-turn-helix transcriptional regulator [Flavobacteriaceae bacterium]MDG1028176.1 helix-turn-helix transcriptional regulator [Flavobacteriaceae bacterium]MDG1941773.1 helix-turn-helix transcriptional regulator [Flavobacteriaceae bacterium]
MEDSEKVLIKQLGKRISFFRKEKGLTQAHLSDLAEMEESAVRRIELGKTNPTFKTLLRISKGLEIPLKQLVDI